MNLQYKDIIKSVENNGFDNTALEFFAYQHLNCEVYKQWCHQMNPINPSVIANIPYLPISFFKTHTILNNHYSLHNVATIFNSSGTTGVQPSTHYVANADVYINSFMAAFEHNYGSINNWCIIGLLPSYLERGNSSLVYMVNHLVQQSTHKQSGFYLHNFNELHKVLLLLEQQQQKVWLIGVTYALIDFFEQFPMVLKNTTLLETGGMKGRKRELLRTEVHELLQQYTGLPQIHAEYGMTELLSQAYLTKGATFVPHKTMKVLVRAEDDPLLVKPVGKGILNIIDLCNVNSVSFIATDDYGEVHADGSFTVLGRVDNSDIRGCSLMYSN
jgi:hypothetical protein